MTHGNKRLLLLIFMLVFPPSCVPLEKVNTSQDVSKLGPFELYVQTVTEPENLIRIFEGLDLSFQMLRSWGRTGRALLKLPFTNPFHFNNYEAVELEPWRRRFYTRVPTKSSREAPRFIKMFDYKPKFFHYFYTAKPSIASKMGEKSSVSWDETASAGTDAASYQQDLNKVIDRRMMTIQHPLYRRKRSTTNKQVRPHWSFPSLHRLAIFRNPENVAKIEKIVDFLNEALGDLDEFIGEDNEGQKQRRKF